VSVDNSSIDDLKKRIRNLEARIEEIKKNNKNAGWLFLGFGFIMFLLGLS